MRFLAEFVVTTYGFESRCSVTDTNFVIKHLVLNISRDLTWPRFFFVVVFGKNTEQLSRPQFHLPPLGSLTS